MVNYERLNLAGLECISATHRDCGGPPRSAAVFCHGFGAPGTDLVPIAEEMIAAARGRLDRMRFVFPAAPLEVDPEYDGRCWWPINMQRMQTALATGMIEDIADVQPAELPDARRRISEIIDWCQQNDGYGSGQILLGGFSQGAMLATDVALHRKGQIGGLCIWSGMMINRAEWQPLVDSARKMRIVQSHGTLDPILPCKVGERLLDNLRTGGHEVEFIRFQGFHQIPAEALQASVELAAKIAASGMTAVQS